MMTETGPRNVHQRLAAVMEEVTYIRKEKKQGMNYTIVSHDAVTAKVRPVLLKHGIVYYPVRCEASHDGNRASCEMTVRFVNVDEPGDFFDVPTFGYGIDPQDKGPGKAMSYAVKYALLKALGLETGDDPDHDDVPYQEHPAPKQASKAKTEPPLSQQAAAKEPAPAAPPPQRTAKHVADGMISYLREAKTRAALAGVFQEPAFKANLARLEEKAPAQAQRINDAADEHEVGLPGPDPLPGEMAAYDAPNGMPEAFA